MSFIENAQTPKEGGMGALQMNLQHGLAKGGPGPTTTKPQGWGKRGGCAQGGIHHTQAHTIETYIKERDRNTRENGFYSL